MDATATDDATLVAGAVAGDRDAFAAIYDRYADRVHTMCIHLLGNRDDAADVCGDVFLTAAERLGQLRDPSRLKPWLFAIARRQVYLRTHRRSRDVLVGEVDDVSTATPADQVESAAESSELATVVRDAAAGLDDTDRLVLELSLQGLEGSDLAAALGVSATNAYQAGHRMKERLERSLGALLVARLGREDCADLDAVLRGWDGTYSVLWRKRVARHVDGCPTCSERRRTVPALLLEGVAGASRWSWPRCRCGPVSWAAWTGAGPVAWTSEAPPAGPGAVTASRPRTDAARRRALVLAAAAVALVVAVGGALLLGGGDVEDVLADGSTSLTFDERPTTTSSSTTTTAVTTVPPGTTVAAAPAEATTTTTTSVPPATRPTVPPAPPSTVPPTTVPAPPTVGSFSAQVPTSPVGPPCLAGALFRTDLSWSTAGAWSVSISADGVSLTGLAASGATVACRATPGAPPGGWTLTAIGPGGTVTATRSLAPRAFGPLGRSAHSSGDPVRNGQKCQVRRGATPAT